MEQLPSSSNGIGIPEKIEAGIERIAATAREAKLRIEDTAASAIHSGEDLLALRDRWQGAAVRCVRNHPATSAGVVLAAVVMLVGASLLLRRPPQS